MKSESGQALLIVVFIGLVLLVAIPIIVFVNMTGAMHHVAAAKRDKGAAVAQEGLAYAIQLLTSNPPNAATWAGYLAQAGNGPLPPADCNDNDITGADGGHFHLLCYGPKSVNCPNCQAYQIYVKATGYTRAGDQTLVPTRTIEAYLSQKTVAGALPTGIYAAAALETGLTPVVGATPGFLWVYNGPIVNHASDGVQWILDQNTDLCLQPRKFSNYAITGTHPVGAPTTPRSGPGPVVFTGPKTDGKEYFAFTDTGFPSVINLPILQTRAKAATGITPPVYCWDPAALPANRQGIQLAPTGCTGAQCPGPVDCCGYFDATTCPKGWAVLDGGGSVSPPANLGQPGFTFNNTSAVIYINGNAILRHVTIDVSNGGAIVVDGDTTAGQGNLTLEDNGDQYPTGGAIYSMPLLRVPPTCALDSPYGQLAQCAPVCAPNSYGYIDIKGFVYAKGTLLLAPNSAPGPGFDPGHWTIDGVVRVDGQLQLTNGPLEIAYDDLINRAIPVQNFQLMIDSQTETSTK